jgi:benzylsuccinate CoA-transferase BbsF subunit
VLDFGWAWAGGVVGSVLADFGADVVKVESRARLDPMRMDRPLLHEENAIEQGSLHQSVNRNKRSIAIDITQPRGAELVRELALTSDVMVENLSPGALDRHGLGYAELAAGNPRLVYLSLGAVGRDGPLRGIRSYAPVITALAGLDALTGYPGERILGLQQGIADPNASLHGVLAVLAALAERDRSGKGQLVDVSQLESLVSLIGGHVVALQLGADVDRAIGDRDTAAAPHGVYPAAGDDAWVAIACTGDPEWSALREVIGDPEWARAPELASAAGRLARVDELDARIGEWTATRDRWDIAQRLQARGVPAAPLLDTADRFADDHLQARGIYASVDHPILGSEMIYGVPWRLSRTPGLSARRGAAPRTAHARDTHIGAGPQRNADRRARSDGSPALSPTRITDAMLARERAKIGEPVGRLQPFVEVATRDAIRHWADGIGDRNPLWTNPAYAARTRWGDVIAPPTMVLAMDRNIVRARGFSGVHGWHMRTDFEWSDVIATGRSLDGTSVVESIEPVESRYAGGTAYDQVIRTDLVDATTRQGVCVTRSFIRRFDREAGERTKKYQRTKQIYTDEQLAAIDQEYQRESPRGAEPRYAEDVHVGDELAPITRGPLTITDCVAFVMGWGGAYIHAHGKAWDFEREHPGVFPRNESNIPDSPERTHWSDAFAQAIGAPAAFDYGPQRIAWCGTLVTNWMGDNAELRRLSVRLVRPNYHGDTVRISGRVRAIDVPSRTATIDFAGINQLGEAVVEGDAGVLLPPR